MGRYSDSFSLRIWTIYLYRRVYQILYNRIEAWLAEVTALVVEGLQNTRKPWIRTPELQMWVSQVPEHCSGKNCAVNIIFKLEVYVLINNFPTYSDILKNPKNKTIVHL